MVLIWTIKGTLFILKDQVLVLNQTPLITGRTRRSDLFQFLKKKEHRCPKIISKNLLICPLYAMNNKHNTQVMLMLLYSASDLLLSSNNGSVKNYGMFSLFKFKNLLYMFIQVTNQYTSFRNQRKISSQKPNKMFHFWFFMFFWMIDIDWLTLLIALATMQDFFKTLCI